MVEQDAIERVAKAIYAHTNVSLTIDGRRATWAQYKDHVSDPRNYLTVSGETVLDQAAAAIAAYNAYLRERANEVDGDVHAIMATYLRQARDQFGAPVDALAEDALDAALDAMLVKESNNDR